MKWKIQEYRILQGHEGALKTQLVKGHVAQIDGGYKIGIHKNAYGIWIVSDIATGARIGTQCYEDTLLKYKKYVEHHERDIRHTLDQGYNNTKRIEQLKKHLESETL